MRIWSSRAASRIVVPSGTVIGLPSMVTVICLPRALACLSSSAVRERWLAGARVSSPIG
jgi:hypothetical protein